MGNIIPKAPTQPAGADPRALNPWQQSRQMRLVGKLLFGLGLLLAVGGILLPPTLLSSAFLCLGLAAFAAGIWYTVKLRREPKPLP
jgi:1,4-dihydroxy-2-naphthoate octaprenyltransferase